MSYFFFFFFLSQKGIRANLCHAQATLLRATQAGVKTLKMYGPRNRGTGLVWRRKNLVMIFMTLSLTSAVTGEASVPVQPQPRPWHEKSSLWSSCPVRSVQPQSGGSITHRYICTWQHTPAGTNSRRCWRSQCLLSQRTKREIKWAFFFFVLDALNTIWAGVLWVYWILRWARFFFQSLTWTTLFEVLQTVWIHFWWLLLNKYCSE